MVTRQPKHDSTGRFSKVYAPTPIDMSQYDLKTVDGCFALLERIAEAALHGEIGSRTHGSLNNTIAIILKHHTDFAKAKEHSEQLAKFEAEIVELRKRIEQREIEAP